MKEQEFYIYNEYFNEYNKLPATLPEEELYDLFCKMYNGDKEAKNKLIEHNIKLVIYIVKKFFSATNFNKKDLVSVGVFGLIKAVSTFDITKNIKFISYATVCIQNEIRMYLRTNSKQQHRTISFEETIYTDLQGNKLNIVEILKADVDIETDYINNEIYTLVRTLVEKLPDKDREIIMMYFGFYGGVEFTQREIAERLGISQSYASRKTKNILKILKRKMELELNQNSKYRYQPKKRTKSKSDNYF